MANKNITLTDAQWLTLAGKYGYTDSIVGSRMGWALKALTVAHSIPSTHAEAIPIAIRITSLLRKGYTADLWPSVPKLHYATKTGGIASAFAGSYKPSRFGERTRLGEKWALVCAEHKANHSKCDTTCKVGVAYEGKPAYAMVKRANGTTAPTAEAKQPQTENERQAALVKKANAKKRSDARKRVETEITEVERSAATAEAIAALKSVG